VILFEAATGIRANLRRIVTQGFSLDEVPAERRRILLNFLWTHAIIMERIRYIPLGWNKKYEFNDSDFWFSKEVGMSWIDAIAVGRTHLRDDEIPWKAIQFLISNCVYGGKVDGISDQRMLSAIARSMFPSQNLESLEAIDRLPPEESPETLWLPQNSGKFLFMQQGIETLRHIVAVNAGSIEAESRESELNTWLQRISSAELEDFSPSTSNLIETVIADEINSLRKTRDIIVSDIQEIFRTWQAGDAMAQKNVRIVADIERGVVPARWNPHLFTGADTNVWLDNFISRIHHFNAAIHDSDRGRGKMNLGLLGHPQSLLAAARQTATSLTKCPIEELKLQVVVGKDVKPEFVYDLVAVDVVSMCAEWKEGNFIATDEVINLLPPMLMRWTREVGTQGVVVPCFTTTSKKVLVFEAVMPVSPEQSDLWWMVRNPALILQPKGL
jgi:dynein heavy chain 1